MSRGHHSRSRLDHPVKFAIYQIHSLMADTLNYEIMLKKVGKKILAVRGIISAVVMDLRAIRERN